MAIALHARQVNASRVHRREPAQTVLQPAQRGCESNPGLVNAHQSIAVRSIPGPRSGHAAAPVGPRPVHSTAQAALDVRRMPRTPCVAPSEQSSIPCAIPGPGAPGSMFLPASFGPEPLEHRPQPYSASPWFISRQDPVWVRMLDESPWDGHRSHFIIEADAGTPWQGILARASRIVSSAYGAVDT